MGFIDKYKKCHKFRDNMGWGTIISLAGCVAFWNLRCHKLVRQINRDLDIMSPETLNKIAWGSSIVAKIIGAGLYINAIKEYKKC